MRNYMYELNVANLCKLINNNNNYNNNDRYSGMLNLAGKERDKQYS